MRLGVVLAALSLAASGAAPAAAETPYLVKDLDSGRTAGSDPTSFEGDATRAVFLATGPSGRVLWLTNGTTSGTGSIVGGENIREPALSGPYVYFVSTGDAPEAVGLWRTTGSGDALVRIKSFTDPGGVDVTDLEDVGGTLYFAVSTFAMPVARSLWKSDGTAAGTVPVKGGFAVLRGFRNVNGTLYFSAGETLSDEELWKSDGSAAGTVRVKDIHPTGSSSPRSLTNVNGTLFFSAADSPAGRSLWKSDGSAPGTTLVWTPPAGVSGFGSFAAVGPTLYFWTADLGPTGITLWKSDGTASGTAAVTPTVGFGFPAALGGKLYFTLADDGLPDFVNALYESDGTAAGTTLVKEFSRSEGSAATGAPLTAAAGRLFFAPDDVHFGFEPWTSDGTAAGTALLRDINTTAAGSRPVSLTDVGSTFFFSASSDAGTELWKSDGSPGGTALVKDLRPGWRSSDPSGLTNVAGTLFFAGDDGVHRVALFRSDGTDAGTGLVKDFTPPSGPAAVVPLAASGGLLFFYVSTGADPSLWVSDGTAAGTVPVLEHAVVGSHTVVAGRFFFASNGPNGSAPGLWSSDGTAAGTTFVKAFGPPGLTGYHPELLTSSSGTLFFTAHDGIDSYRLWKSDGTPGGTTLVGGPALDAGCSPGFCTQPPLLTAAGGLVFFVGTDPSHGYELWRSDGTAAGTFRVSEIEPGPASASIGWLAAAGGRVFFSASEASTGRELWTSDGTVAGTGLVKDLNPGTADGVGYPRAFAALGGAFYFVGLSPGNGLQIFRTDGTAAGTNAVTGFATMDAMTLRELFVSGGRLYFIIKTAAVGEELWALDGPAPLSFYTIPPCRVFDSRMSDSQAIGSIGPNNTQTIPVGGKCGVPLDAKAVAANVTVVGASFPGHLTLFAAGAAPPATSTINFLPGQVRANNAVLPLGGALAASVSVKAVTDGATHLILDVAGYFR